MATKQLSDDEIKKIFAGQQKRKKKEEEEFNEVTLSVPGEKVFFEATTFTDEDWMQKENMKFPFYIYVDNDKMTLKDIVPHTYSIAARAMKQMYMNRERQAIVISGESGAGKTEAAKIAMSFLAGPTPGKQKASGSGAAKGIEDRIIACNPVLEAFGNAKTPRNYNSSRFGKYVKIIFDIKGRQIRGAVTKPYLLEKSRIVKITELDRNYHIFYHLIKGAPPALLKELYLTDASGKGLTKDGFEYLKYGCDDIPTHLIDDVELYKELVAKFEGDLGFTTEEISTIWHIVAAVLHLGNVELDTAAYDIVKNAPCKVKNQTALETTAKLLGCKPEDLQYEITYRGKVGDAKRVVCTPTEAVNQRDTLAKTLYNNLFSWLVTKMNKKILDDESLLDNNRSDIKTIGLLDIFGFECFQINDYEQLLINYTNEKLQKLYLNAVFEAEKITFKEEGLADLIGKLKYTDRTTCVIELLDNRAPGKPQGIFNKIDDYKKNEDAKNLRSMIAKDFDHHDNYVKYRDPEKFQIKHTAKLVLYSPKEFIEKNLDKMSDDLKAMMYERMNPQICAILKSEEGANLGNTIWKKFSVQMKDLMEELAESAITGKKTEKSQPCELHFIRCIKPNEKANNNMFVDSLVLMQITYMGVLDTIKVRKVNFPNRIKYSRFYERYEDLCSISTSTPLKILLKQKPNFTELTKQIMREQFGELGRELYVFGVTKIFMRNEVITALEEARVRAQKRKNDASNYVVDCFYACVARTRQAKQMRAFVKLQTRYHKRFEATRTFNALRFCAKFEKAFGTYKTEKRKAVEENACKKVAEAARTVCVRSIVQKGIEARHRVLKRLLWISGRNKVQRVIVNLGIVMKVFRKSWAQVMRSMLGGAARCLVCVCKGHAIRASFAGKIVEAREKAIYHANSKGTSSGWREFQQLQDSRLESLRALETSILFGPTSELPTNGPTIFEATSMARHLRASSPYFQQKVYVFTLICDIHLLTDTTEIYSPTWATKYAELAAEMLDSDTPVIGIQSGLDHTLALNSKSQIFSWGLAADEGRKPAAMAVCDARIKQVACGNAHSAVLDQEGNLYLWGANRKGQLGTGNYEDVWQPQRMIHGVPCGEVKQVAVCEDTNIAVTNDGEAFMWPIRDRLNEPVLIPTKLPFTKQVQIEAAACGHDFALLLTTQGLVFSFGKEAAEGQLGQGDRRPRAQPELVKSLKECGERIQSIACGYQHAVAKSALGKVYTWGWGGLGQLGQGTLESVLTPKRLAVFKEAATAKDSEATKRKALSIAAGYSHTVVLTEGRVPYWCGTCGTITKQAVAVRVNIEKKYPDLFPPKSVSQYSSSTGLPAFAPAKIFVTWTKSMALTCIGVLDMRSVPAAPATGTSPSGNQGPTSASNVSTQLNVLSSKWSPEDIDPPYLDTLAGVFSASVMRKSAAASPGKRKPVARPSVQVLMRNSLRRGLARPQGEGEVEAKAREVELELQAALERDPEARSVDENMMISHFVNKMSTGK